MKHILLSFILVAVGFLTINAQTLDTLVTFEATADTTGWEIFANGEGAATDVMVVENPDSSAVNPTDSVLMFTVNDDAAQWAGMVLRKAFTGDSAIAITEEQHVFTMLVHRSKVGRVGLKLENEVTDSTLVAEVIDTTTLVDEWEVVKFDFSNFIGKTYQSLVLFPDFPAEARTEGAIVYLDNVVFGEEGTTSAPLVEKTQLKVYPNPASDRLYVQHPGMSGYAISNSLGQEIEREVFGITNQRTIEISRLRTGIHFLTVQSQNGIHTTRFIKK